MAKNKQPAGGRRATATSSSPGKPEFVATGLGGAQYHNVYYRRQQDGIPVDPQELRETLAIDATAQGFLSFGQLALGGGAALVFDHVRAQPFQLTTPLIVGFSLCAIGAGFMIGGGVLFFLRRGKIRNIMDRTERIDPPAPETISNAG